MECDVCKQSDMETNVYGSSVGPVSFAYCEVCASLGAESKGVLDMLVEGHPEHFNFQNTLYYDEEIDNYRYYGDNKIVVLQLKSGKTFSNRCELVEFLNKK